MATTSKPKLDLNQLAKRILDESTGDSPKTERAPSKKLESGRNDAAKAPKPPKKASRAR